MFQVKPIKTSIYESSMELSEFIKNHIGDSFKEGQILAITTKIVSLAENRVVKRLGISKEELVRREADRFLCQGMYDCFLTYKEGLLIPSSGIDESNSRAGDYILYPKNPFESAKQIHASLKAYFGFNNFGVLLTDSTTKPLRKGVTGVAVAYYGFRGVRDQRGQKDLFDRELKMTQINIVDTLAAMATLVMGEGGESTPLAIINGEVEWIESQDNSEIRVPWEEDLYGPLLGPH